MNALLCVLQRVSGDGAARFGFQYRTIDVQSRDRHTCQEARDAEAGTIDHVHRHAQDAERSNDDAPYDQVFGVFAALAVFHPFDSRDQLADAAD